MTKTPLPTRTPEQLQRASTLLSLHVTMQEYPHFFNFSGAELDAFYDELRSALRDVGLLVDPLQTSRES